jgi:ubiquinone/menaquinone biosynthesis C-methylase UbiE
VRELLERVHRSEAALWRATDRFSRRETARIAALDDAWLDLRTEHFEPSRRPELFLSFELEGRPYFFAAPKLEEREGGRVRIAWPAVVYEAERRDRERRRPRASSGDPARVALRPGRDRPLEGSVADLSPGGLGLRLSRSGRLDRGARVEVHYLDGARRGEHDFGEVRRRGPERAGWVRIGLAVSEHPWQGRIPVERRASILEGEPSLGPVSGCLSPSPEVVRYPDGEGRPLCGIVDRWGDPKRATAVVVPSAWGRTKETLLPLAATVLATFRAAGQPVVVIRFDGIGRRGESWRAPECVEPGLENLRFTFSQAARDIHATLDFLERPPAHRAAAAVLVTFSVASIEGRRALATDARGRLDGWVSVVGSADVQSLTRAISGGVDYFGGMERGLRFGRQELQGLLVDMDHAGRDALAERLAFLADARRDFASIRAPVTWLHGRHDAWMDLERVREALSFGDGSRRRLLEIPTGHQLRTSREALEAFQLIASEVARLALGRLLPAALPDPGELERRREAERERVEARPIDLRSFWSDYLLGRGGGLGMELVTHAAPYEGLMARQIDWISLREGDEVLDLGSGVGSFPLQLARHPDRPRVRVTEADYVRAALRRARSRLASALGRGGANGLQVRYVELDLGCLAAGCGLPFREQAFDAVLASLVLNYVEDPRALLGEAWRLLRPGGRLVLSSLKRDADISNICVDTVADLRRGRGRSALGREGERRLGRSLQSFINDAARLLELEEQGLFRFWDASELAELVRQAGFEAVVVEPGFGSPPQAELLRALRP